MEDNQYLILVLCAVMKNKLGYINYNTYLCTEQLKTNKLMAKRKIYITVKTRLIIEIEEGVEVNEVMQELDYNFISGTNGADIIDSEISEFDITN